MHTQKFTSKILNVCIISLLLIGICFTVLSCNKKDTKTVTDAANSNSEKIISSEAVSSSESSAAPAVSNTQSSSAAEEKDITTSENKKIFMNSVYNYYNETVGRDYHNNVKPPYICINYTGEITRNNAEAIIRCAIDQNLTGSRLQEYAVSHGNDGWYYEIPQNIGDQIIKDSFDVGTIDHSIFKCYDAKKQKYIIYHEDFGGSGELFAAPDIKSIRQSGDKIVIDAGFYEMVVQKDGTMPMTEYGTAAPNYNKKLQSMRFTLKKNGGKYLYEKAETI